MGDGEPATVSIDEIITFETTRSDGRHPSDLGPVDSDTAEANRLGPCNPAPRPGRITVTTVRIANLCR